MNINSNDLLTVLSEALDCVEKEVLGVTDYHAKRVAWLGIQMAKAANLSEKEIANIAIAALLHDNALNAVKMDYENGNLKDGISGEKHCIAGAKNIELISDDPTIKEYVLFHHERANGSGPFGKLAHNTPLGAQIIHIADQIDLAFALGSIDVNRLSDISEYVANQINTLFSKEVSELFLSVLSPQMLNTLAIKNINNLVLDFTPFPLSATKQIAELFARIIDYKSPFTKVHSIGLANKAEQMGKFYNYDEEHITNLFIAGALHDIGKIFVNNEVLEKPGRLNDEEYKHIQSHAYETYRLLSKIKGLEDIRDWASYHHEKLNGKGYPFGLAGENMTKEMRLLACLDIYQALTEDRPYKTGMPHGKAISILFELAEKEELDLGIVSDINSVFSDGNSYEQTESVALFQCKVCGFIYEGDSIPYDYECPVCGQAAHVFSRIQ
ncbi:MAG: HD domain-containing protein [Erysipelotrichales bacterium]|nr:HD domain-containing protein [Erysipelotrichales bacterium]